jgi:catechol 2,3-dioxygenase-like lactoylglutathione lyase family enzyme
MQRQSLILLVMKQYIAYITILVTNYDEALQFYIEKLNFDLVEDTRIDENKRWVLVRPKGSTECCLLLAKAVGEEQESLIGQQTGGRVFLFLRTDDFWRDYNNMKGKNIYFVREPQSEPYGTVAVFKDPFGNLWDLLG